MALPPLEVPDSLPDVASQRLGPADVAPAAIRRVAASHVLVLGFTDEVLHLVAVIAAPAPGSAARSSMMGADADESEAGYFVSAAACADAVLS